MINLRLLDVFMCPQKFLGNGELLLGFKSITGRIHSDFRRTLMYKPAAEMPWSFNRKIMKNYCYDGPHRKNLVMIENTWEGNN